MAFNFVVLTGRLTDTPEQKTTPNGVSVTTFSIAVDRPYRKDQDRQADFIDIVAWRGTAEFICKNFTKGSLIGIRGSLQTRSYKDKNGYNRTVYEVVADEAQFILPKSANITVLDDTEGKTFSKPNNTVDVEFEEIPDDTDLPF